MIQSIHKKQIAYENGNIVFKTEAQRLAKIKADLINLLQYRTTVYITTYYPDWKQRLLKMPPVKMIYLLQIH